MTEKKPKVKLAYLSDVLYVPTEHVRQEHLNAYTYKFEKAVYEQPDEVVRKCGNCKYWRVPWMNHNGEEVLCHLKGYTEKDYCAKFFPKPVKRIEEHEVITYNQPNNEFYTFGRGDLGKVERVFHDFQFVDQRSAPKLGINLKLKEGRTLYPDQVKIVEDWLKHGYGILKAPVGAGKCCSGDTLISTNKGLIPIKDIVDPILDVSKNSYEGFEFSDISSLNLRATAFGQDAQISAVCRKKSKTLKVTTNWGYSIEVTPEHPLLTLSKGKEVWVEAKDLKITDKIAIRGINLSGEPSDFDNWWEHSYIANITHVPIRLLKLGKSKIRDFLREYFTLQGEVVIAEGTITCKSEYKKVIQEIQILLLGFNIPSIINQKEEGSWSLQIFGTQSNKFQLEIGFNPESKLAEELNNFAESSLYKDTDKFVWYPSIKTIEPGEEQWVYDITVPDGHWYVANGIVSHNTVMWAYLVQHIGLKSLLLAQEVRHLQVGFEGLYEHTNIAELEKEAGTNLCGRLGHEHYFDSTGKAVFKKSKDIGKTYPITFSTFQALNSKNGKELMSKGMKDEFGLVWLEECHHESAETFHNVVKSFNSYYKGGQSATPTRKDQLHCATYDTIGPVTAVGTKEQMTCQYTFISTGVTAPDRLFFGQYPLPKLFTFISMNKEIQECIFQWILYDIQSGRKPLYITERKADAFSLRDKIHISGYNVELIMGGSEAKKQSEYSDRLQDGSLHAIIGTKVIKENYNIPPLDTLHLAYPNFGVESEEQMTGRIRRYVLDSQGNPIHKNQPLIRVYTVGANNTIPKKAMEFRRAFYRKMNFEEYQLDTTNSEIIENERETLTKKLME